MRQQWYSAEHHMIIITFTLGLEFFYVSMAKIVFWLSITLISFSFKFFLFSYNPIIRQNLFVGKHHFVSLSSFIFSNDLIRAVSRLSPISSYILSVICAFTLQTIYLHMESYDRIYLVIFLCTQFHRPEEDYVVSLHAVSCSLHSSHV